MTTTPDPDPLGIEEMRATATQLLSSQPPDDLNVVVALARGHFPLLVDDIERLIRNRAIPDSKRRTARAAIERARAVQAREIGPSQEQYLTLARQHGRALRTLINHYLGLMAAAQRASTEPVVGGR